MEKTYKLCRLHISSFFIHVFATTSEWYRLSDSIKARKGDERWLLFVSWVIFFIPHIFLLLYVCTSTHSCRINRILESPRGNALLVGVGGSGKQSLARLAAFISNLEVFQITLKKSYSVSDLKVCAVLHTKNILYQTTNIYCHSAAFQIICGFCKIKCFCIFLSKRIFFNLVLQYNTENSHGCYEQGEQKEQQKLLILLLIIKYY